MTSKSIGFGFMCISTALYLGHYIVTAACLTTSRGDIRGEPRTIAAIALIAGIIYIIRGEVREYADRKEQSLNPD